MNEENVTVAVGDSVHTENGQIDEYDADSGDEDDGACSDDFSEVPVSRACVTKSGRVVLAFLRMISEV